jgi:DNA-binding MarR family transcriptional regulator
VEWVEGFAIGLAVGALAVFGLRALVLHLQKRRERPSRPLIVPPSVFAEESSGKPARVPPDLPGTPTGAPGGPWRSLAFPSVLRTTPGAEAAPPNLGVPVPSHVRLSRRIVLHLYGMGRPGPDEVGLPGATQRGIGLALAAEQSAVSKVLQRLLAAEVVEVARRHVRGQDRRVNVYSLTRRGELLAHELQARSPARPEASRRSTPRPGPVASERNLAPFAR